MNFNVKKKNNTEIFWVKLINTSFWWLLNEIKSRFSCGKKTFITTPNPDILNRSLKDKKFRNILQKSDFATPDAIWLYLAYQILEYNNKILRILLLPYFIFNIIFRKNYLYKKYGERICGSDLTLELLNIINKNENKIKIWIIDVFQIWDDKISQQKKYIQENFDKLFGKKYPNINYKLILYKNGDDKKLYDIIQKEKIKIAFVTLWSRTQEIVSYNIIQNTDCIVSLWIGSSFDYITGFQKRAPKKFGDSGFEWLYRLVVSPGRWNRIKRIYNSIVVFSFNVICS